MQVLLFAGSDFYPRSHVGDLVGTLAQMPTTEEVVKWVSQFMASEERFESPTCSVDWVTALGVSTDPDQECERKAWKCFHVNDPVRMRRERYPHIWQDAEGDWHAVREVDEEDMLQLRASPLTTWPTRP